MKKGLLASVMALALCFGGCAQPSEPAPVTQPYQAQQASAYEKIGDRFCAMDPAQLGAVGSEWMIVGLAQSGRLSREAAQTYVQSAQDYVAQIGSSRLHKSKCTANVRVILALTAAGADATDVAGFHLLEGLSDMTYVTKQGLNGPIWALIALDCAGYAPVAPMTRQALVDKILSAQNEDGGWSLTAGESDPDVTAMALQALAPYREQAAEPVERALSYLSGAQSEDGGYEAYGLSTSETCAQVIVALTALDIDPDGDARFVKNGNSVLDALLAFAVEEGFCHTLDTPKLDNVATEQGYYALVAYHRFLNGGGALYDMTK
ncbi:MAG: terpene cyclase/mutase family protein [Oscillospiraceae bacterium]|nr:terpene cyclase/mutase family protein [Oscillospiraceae bacterium]